MVLVSMILLGLIFFTSEQIRNAVKTQIPVQVQTILSAEAGKIGVAMGAHEKTAEHLARMSSTIQFLSWFDQYAEEVELIEQWRQVVRVPVNSLLAESEDYLGNDIFAVAILNEDGETALHSGRGGEVLSLDDQSFKRYVKIMHESLVVDGVFRSPVFFQMGADDMRERACYIFKPIFSQRKRIGVVCLGIRLESLFENIPGSFLP